MLTCRRTKHLCCYHGDQSVAGSDSWFCWVFGAGSSHCLLTVCCSTMSQSGDNEKQEGSRRVTYDLQGQDPKLMMMRIKFNVDVQLEEKLFVFQLICGENDPILQSKRSFPVKSDSVALCWLSLLLHSPGLFFWSFFSFLFNSFVFMSRLNIWLLCKNVCITYSKICGEK